MTSTYCRPIGFLTLILLLIVGCAGTKIFQQPEIIKPLDTYNDPVLKDVAQMLYPGFLEIKTEFQKQFGNNQLELMEYGLQVLQLPAEADISEGYYVSVTTRILSEVQHDIPFEDQAQRITEQYIHNVLLVLSRDWNNVFSPSIAGVKVEFFWGNHESPSQNMLSFILENQDVQDYLNARMTLQELIDKNWVEGVERGKSLGRIELNGLGVEQL